jgi:phosphoribosylamine---glycine ligase
MKVLVIGGGGREHAIVWKLLQNLNITKIYCSPGNGSTAMENKCENISISGNNELAQFAVKEKIDLTIVGPEQALTEGIVDVFKSHGLKIFGPSKMAAALEGSKSYAKSFMKKYGVSTAKSETFEDLDSALTYVKSCEYPVVIKADGLAAGKGVVICEDYNMTVKTIEDFMNKDIFNGAGKKIIIEEYLNGVEASILSVTDGSVILPFISAKDHKQIFDGNKGPNTGGMGAISPNPYCTQKVLNDFTENILKPTIKGIKQEKLDFVGVIFFGLMITEKGTYLLEYNCRFGDPETQAVLMLMESDLADLLNAAVDKKLSCFNLKWKQGHSCCVVAASNGYPGKYKTGFKITGLNKTKMIFGAGVKYEDGVLKTSGGRVLCSLGCGETLEEAIKTAYSEMSNIHFEGIYYRKDIGKVNIK